MNRVCTHAHKTHVCMLFVHNTFGTENRQLFRRKLLAYQRHLHCMHTYKVPMWNIVIWIFYMYLCLVAKVIDISSGGHPNIEPTTTSLTVQMHRNHVLSLPFLIHVVSFGPFNLPNRFDRLPQAEHGLPWGIVFSSEHVLSPHAITGILSPDPPSSPPS